ncbi:two-component system phosphate regulon sensor histidine kinase PhoR [Pedobacter sp. CG_S7]|uniref:sensor histidine kinase n=1 Tax=Pedobacter sp. CG_S7 TaxID=3143930 RepID=UPI003399FD08
MVMTLEKKSGYRKNFYLIVTFIILMSGLLILSLFFVYNFSKKFVENEFVSEKVKVLEESIQPYNDFFQNKLPEVSYYNGYLDSATTAKYVDTLLLEYPFVSRVVFYDSEITNGTVKDGLNTGYFSFGPRAIYQFGSYISADSIKLFSTEGHQTFKRGDDFNTLGIKLISFIESLDTTKAPTQDQLFSNLSIVRSNRITYLNFPRFDDLKVYKQMLRKKLDPAPVYQQDMLTFHLDPFKIKIINRYKHLYQNIRIAPLTYDPLDMTWDFKSTEITLPGPFSDYKLYFISAKTFLDKEILLYFLPIALVVLAFYGILVLVAFLIFRNLNINHRMFKLQYDFVNNLTHEFKTPVSVIKIAGNNIKSATSLTDRELKLYGRILDEEADKLNGLMNKLLAFTQIENKAIQLNEDEINIRDFIESTIESHQLKHPDFDFTYDVAGFSTFITDPVLLGSLFDNLAENAYKYSPPERKKLHITARLHKGKVIFTFTDKGIGIPTPQIGSIFKKFFRIQNIYNQNGSVGLGLAFCKELVNFMKGEITVKSTVNKGTEFKIVLPFND